MDPQPGDIARAGGLCRWVVRVDRGQLFIDGGRTRYRMNIVVWRQWCVSATPRFAWKDPKLSFLLKHF